MKGRLHYNTKNIILEYDRHVRGMCSVGAEWQERIDFCFSARDEDVCVCDERVSRYVWVTK